MAQDAAGYSGTPLPKKLGIAADTTVVVLGSPLDFDLAKLGARATPAPDEPCAVVVLFCPDEAMLVEQFDDARDAHSTAGALWVCWPKQRSGVPTDLTERTVREYGLAHGQVDVKVAAIDSVWSGLKFVTRLSDR